ncbi:protein kinase [Pseudenhygromyxa sp. WMMC2535]|uniref:protein kinase domain-containing protein n=1 Tax=Pseudenhygromyxa sp. WMMC2535 TaxID=2712867 RepID=UPI001595A255|nr:protein kinase [Pseudenhygromyxa sp. WMMC2535]NVB37522.1 protein kinase [Pseudenhygromyxa sp. WMMC2535]
MPELSHELVAAIQAGDCVLWTGAGIGILADRPNWPSLLRTLTADAEQPARAELEALIDAGDRSTALDWVLRERGRDAVEALIGPRRVSEDDAPLPEAARALGALPWRACLATAHADLLAQACAAHQRPMASELEAANAGFSGDPFLLYTSPSAPLSQLRDLRELVEEAARTRTLALVGFELGDPDLEQILAMLAEIAEATDAGRPDSQARTHYLFVSELSAVAAASLRERCAVEAVAVDDLAKLLTHLAEAAEVGEQRVSRASEHLPALELARALASVPERVDLGVDAAFCVDPQELERLVEALPGGLEALPSRDLLRLGGVWLAHRRKRSLDRARKAFQQVVTREADAHDQRLARFNLALLALLEGDEDAARLGLEAAAEQDRGLTLVPPRFAVETVRGRVGSRIWFECRDRAHDGRRVGLEVGVIGRPVSTSERERFAAQVESLAAIDHPAMVSLLGSVSEGRMFGVIMDPVQGVPLSTLLDETHEPLALDKAFEIIGPLMEVVTIVHAKGLVHRNLHPRHVLITQDGAQLRGFGFLPLVSWSRPTIVRENFGYAAPELLASAAPSPASDTYALAAMLYRCITGRRPQGSVPAPSRLVPGIDRRVDALLAAAMHPDAEQRPEPKTLRTEIATILTTPHKADQVDHRMAAPEPVASAPSTRIIEPTDPEDLEGWIAVLERKPANLPAREAINRIEREARAAERWDRVVDALAVRARVSQAEGEKIVLLRELAQICEERLQAPGDALSAVLDLVDAVSINAQLPLVDELLRLAEVTGRWAPVAAKLRAIGRRLPQLDDQLRVLARAAQIYIEQVGELESALAIYEDALDLEPENLELQRTALAAYRKADKPAELATGLLTVAELESGAARVDALLEAAELLGELGEHEGALEAAEHARADAPEDERALAACERWARALERWETLAEALAARAELASDPAEASAMRHEAAALMRERLDDEAGAIAQYRRLIERDRGDSQAAEALVALLRPKIDSDTGEAASAREGLIDALSVLTEASDDVGRRGELLAESAALLDREADGSERAADCREQIVSTLPVDHPLVVEAVEALTVAYRAAQNHRGLAELLERRAKSTVLDDSLRVAAYRELLTLATGPLDDAERGRQALEALVNLDPKGGDAQGKWRDQLIAQLREEGDEARAESLLRQRIAEAERPEDRAEMLVDVARMREQAGELEEAEAQVREALELDDSLSAGWTLLQHILEQRERPLEALEAQVRAARSAKETREQVRGLFAAAKAWIETLARPERGLPLLREVIELDPHHDEATARFAELLIERGDLEEAWPHAQRWVSQLRAKSPDDRVAMAHAHALAGRCALAVHDKDKARELLRVAKESDPRNAEVARALADLELESESWEAALKAYQGLALQTGQGDAAKTADPRAQAELYLRMGQARRGMGETAKALQMIERALEHDPSYADAARFLVELADSPGAKAEAQTRLVDVLAAELAALPEDDERRAAKDGELLDLRLELASTLAEALNRPEEAVAQMQAVLARRGEDLALLHKALDLYSNAGQWAEAVAVLDRLAALQDHGPIQAKYRYAAASLVRAHDLDPSGEQLRARLIAVLDADPLHDKAFGLVVEQLEAAGEVRELSKVLRARLKATPEDAEPGPRIALLDRIAVLYERELDDKRTAMIAYEQAIALARQSGVPEGDAKQNERRDKVISLSVQLGDDAIDKGIEQVQALIRDNQLDYDSYHRLVELYLAGKQRDAAIVVSRTLRFLKQADEAELELADEASADYQPPRGTISRKLWRDVLLVSDARLSDLYGLLWPVMAAREARSYGAMGLDRQKREAVNLQAPGVARWLAFAAQIIDMPAPDLFTRKGTPGGLNVVALVEGGVHPTVLAGDDALAKQPDTAMAVRAGRAVARCHPHLLAASVLPSSGSLRDVIYGAVALTHPQVAIPKELREGARSWGELIKKVLPPARVDDLRKTVAKVIERGGADTKSWLRGCEHTAARVGFLLSDNIDVSARVFLQGGLGGQVEGRELLKGLIAFSVSGEYMQLRRSLKLGR